MKRWIWNTMTRLLPALIGLAACAGPAGAAHAGTLSPDLQQQVQAAPLSVQPRRVIVQLSRPVLSAPTFAQAYGGIFTGRLKLINALVLVVPQVCLSQLAGDSAVTRVSPDRLLIAHADVNTASTGAEQVWQDTGNRGGGVRVAVLDTGVAGAKADWQPAGGGASRIAAWCDLVNGQSNPYDDHGHGTHVAGIVLGSGQSSAGSWTGTAPGADLVAVKVLDGNASGLASTVIQGIDWCVQNRQSLQIRVLNLSLGQKPGESSITDPLCTAVRQAVAAGMVVVVSAGNKGRNTQGQVVYGGIGCPGNEPAALTVGALNTVGTVDRGDDVVCGFSSRGPTYLDHWAKPDLLAPGNQVVSVRSAGSYLDTAYPGNRETYPGSASADYFRLSGSSAAAPQVAGIVALMLQANPGLQPNTVKGLLQYTAERLVVRDDAGTPLPEGLSTLTQGAGAVNAVGAVSLAGMLNASSAVGAWWQSASPSGASTIAGHWFSWYGGVLWGSSLYSGGDLLGYRQRAWSMEHFWGDATTWFGSVTAASNGVDAGSGTWGSESVWNDSLLWGDQFSWGEEFTQTSGEANPLPPGSEN